jgi:hypothetical protein
MFHTIVGSLVATIRVSFEMKQTMTLIIGLSFFVRMTLSRANLMIAFPTPKPRTSRTCLEATNIHEKGFGQEIFFLGLAVRWLSPGEHPTVDGSCGLVKLREWGSFLS